MASHMLMKFLQQHRLSHDEFLRFEWKSMQTDVVTLRYSIVKTNVMTNLCADRVNPE